MLMQPLARKAAKNEQRTIIRAQVCVGHAREAHFLLAPFPQIAYPATVVLRRIRRIAGKEASRGG
jgi:hypothetical protein